MVSPSSNRAELDLVSTIFKDVPDVKVDLVQIGDKCRVKVTTENKQLLCDLGLYRSASVDAFLMAKSFRAETQFPLYNEFLRACIWPEAGVYRQYTDEMLDRAADAWYVYNELNWGKNACLLWNTWLSRNPGWVQSHIPGMEAALGIKLPRLHVSVACSDKLMDKVYAELLSMQEALNSFLENCTKDLQKDVPLLESTVFILRRNMGRINDMLPKHPGRD